MCKRKFRFFLTINDADPVRVYPVWNDRHERRAEREGEEVFYRYRIEEPFKFMRHDYDLIFPEGIETEFKLLIEIDADGGGSWSEYWTGVFYRHDCTINEDEKRIEAKVEPLDRYTEILAGLDKEYDLISLEPEKTPFAYTVQPLIQVYFRGAPVLTNILGDTYWEQQVTNVITDSVELTDTYEFTANLPGTYYVTGLDAVNPDVSGMYFFDLTAGYSRFLRSDSLYYIVLNGTIWRIKLTSDDSTIFEGVSGEDLVSDVTVDSYKNPGDVLTSVSNPAEQVTVFYAEPYYRILTALDAVSGYTVDPIPTDDIIPPPVRYTNVIQGVDFGNFFGTDRSRTDSTRWAKIPGNSVNKPNEYLLPPAGVSLADGRYYPIVSSEWAYMGWWFEFSDELRDLQKDGGRFIIVNDGYKLADVLDVLLGQIDPTLTHAEDLNHSNFYYNFGNALRGIDVYPLITSKSNVLSNGYDQPARKAPIKLSDVFQLLWILHRVKWYIDDNNRLVLEHRHFFDNGGRYDAFGQQVGENALIGSDLTLLKEPKTGLRWDYSTKEYTYEKASLPERFEFQFMDKQSFPFEGYPIGIRSRYIQRGNIQKDQVGMFSADIDFAIADPTTISPDGFFYFELIIDELGPLETPFVEMTIGLDEFYKMQNGYASFLYSVPAFHRYGLPAELITINKEDTTALTVERSKVQEEVSLPADDFDPLNLVKTSLGNGKAESIIENMSSGIKKVTIRYEP